MPSTTLLIYGLPVDLPRAAIVVKCVPYVRGGVPSLVFQVRGGPMPALPDPYLKKVVELRIDPTGVPTGLPAGSGVSSPPGVVATPGATPTWGSGTWGTGGGPHLGTWDTASTTIFLGSVVSCTPAHDDRLGWVRTYQCLGCRWWLDQFPHTDSTFLLDTSQYNLPVDSQSFADQSFLGGREGRTVGQVLADVLAMPENAVALNSLGQGNLTQSGGTWTLPADTAADLAAMTVIPPSSVTFLGEKFGAALEGFLTTSAPNHCLWTDPETGNLRFLDTRTFTPHTLTLGVDPVLPTPLSRDLTNCFQRVVVRGSPIADLVVLKLSQGTLVEDFGYGSTSNSAAKAAYKPINFTGNSQYQDAGTCNATSSTTVAISSTANPRPTWAADGLDQSPTGAHAVVTLWSSVTTGVAAYFSARVIANTAGTGSSTLTVDRPMPAANFDHYTLTWNVNGPANVYRKYKIADPALWPLVVGQTSYPQPVVLPGGSAMLTSGPLAEVFGDDGRAFPLPFQYLGNGELLFAASTYGVANNSPPVDVWAWLPINRGPNQVVAPPDSGEGFHQYAGTSYTVDGFQGTHTISVPEWRDPGDAPAMLAYAQDILDSEKDAVVEGVVTYLGVYPPALKMGAALSIAAHGYPAPYGWDGMVLPIVECEVTWNDGVLWTTRMRVSNRRHHYGGGMFCHPARTGLTWGLPDGSILDLTKPPPPLPPPQAAAGDEA